MHQVSQAYETRRGSGPRRLQTEPVSGYAPDHGIYRTALTHFRVLARLVPAEGVAPSLAAFYARCLCYWTTQGWHVASVLPRARSDLEFVLREAGARRVKIEAVNGICTRILALATPSSTRLSYDRKAKKNKHLQTNSGRRIIPLAVFQDFRRPASSKNKKPRSNICEQGETEIYFSISSLPTRLSSSLDWVSVRSCRNNCTNRLIFPNGRLSLSR